MKIIKCLFASAILCFTSSLLAQEAAISEATSNDDLSSAFISDDLFIYMLAGPGKNYRILGSISAGEEIKLTGQVQNDYSQIIDGKNRTTWVETKYVSQSAGLRVVIAELNGKLANREDGNIRLTEQLSTAQNDIAQLTQTSQQLATELSLLKEQLTVSESKLSSQDLDIKKEWFFNGAIVLVIGLILGLIIPRIPVRKKASMQSWK